MTAVFVALLNRSIAAGWLILAVILLRLCLKKAPRWSLSLLWAMVGLRLVCPFSIRSVLSLIPSAHTVPEDIGFAMIPAIDSGVSSIDAMVNPFVSQFAPPTTLSSINPIQIFGAILANIWFLGLLVMVAYAAFTWIRLARQVRTAVLLRDRIYQTDAMDSPFVLGFLKPRIYLPFSLKEPELSHVLAHEMAHIRRKDHWWKPLGFLLLSLHWFNPLVWIAWILLCRDIELACDEAVIRDLNREGRADYSQALLSFSHRTRLIAACPLAFGEVGVKERVKNVIRYQKPAFWLTLIAAVLCVVVAVCFLTDPARQEKSETYTFQAVVLERNYQSILVRPLPGSEAVISSDQVIVSTVYEDESLALERGDTVAIEFSGIVIETYPVQITKPFKILKIASAADRENIQDLLEQNESELEAIQKELQNHLKDAQDKQLENQLIANFNGILYANPGTPSPMEVDPSAIIGTLHTQVEGRPVNHCQANFDCVGCSYARLMEGYAVLIDNEWYLFTEVKFASPTYYLTIPEEGVCFIQIHDGSRTYLICKETLAPYQKGEEVYLECITGRLHLRGVTLTCRDADNQDIFSVSVASHTHGLDHDHTFSNIECDGWIIRQEP